MYTYRLSFLIRSLFTEEPIINYVERAKNLDFETALIFKPRFIKCSNFARVPAPTLGYSGQKDFPSASLYKKFQRIIDQKIGPVVPFFVSKSVNICVLKML